MCWPRIFNFSYLASKRGKHHLVIDIPSLLLNVQRSATEIVSSGKKKKKGPKRSYTLKKKAESYGIELKQVKVSDYLPINGSEKDD